MEKYKRKMTYLQTGTEPGLRVKGGKNINKFFFFKLQIIIHLTLTNHHKNKYTKFLFFNTLKCINKHSSHTADKPQQLIKTH